MGVTATNVLMSFKEIHALLPFDEDERYLPNSVEYSALLAVKFMLADDIPMLKAVTPSRLFFLETLFADVYALIDIVNMFMDIPDIWLFEGYYNGAVLNDYWENEVLPILTVPNVPEMVARSFLHGFAQIEKAMLYYSSEVDRSIPKEEMIQYLRCVFAFFFSAGTAIDKERITLQG